MEFYEPDTHLFEADTHYVLRDQNIIFGFEKNTYSFPKIEFDEHLTVDNVLVGRSEILDELRRISVVSTGPDQLVRLELQGAGATALLTLTTKDGDRKTSRTRLNCTRSSNDSTKVEFERWRYLINLAKLIKAFSHFESVNVHLQLGSRKLFILDEGDGFTTRAVLSLMDRVPKLT